MDVEVEQVAKILFPEAVPESWKDNEDFSNYIVQLASCGVEKLGKEGAHLREERTSILDQTKDLAYTNYKTFIHTADCSKTIYNDFTSVESHLEGLSARLPSLKGRVEGFLNTSKHLAQSRHLTSLTLTKHTQLLEILELPQLMDTCVRNGYYEEALEILAYVRRLEKKHIDIPIIAGIVTEVQAGTRLMLSQLLAQLRSPLALPQCLKVIGLLRRLDVFTEPELRLKFLQARDSWFNGILKSIPKDDAYQHIIKVVEASRVHLFDIVTQYRAIFSDDDSRFTIADPEINEQGIFHGWILHKVNQFLAVVGGDLERGVGSNLEAVLAQCMFFGQSFSRIGADFRNLLIPLFQKAAMMQCERNVRAANIKFDETLSCFSLMEAHQLSSASSFMAETQDKTRPPLNLMEFTPLAHYLNGLVATFNSLRQCCPVATLPEVLKLLQQSMKKVIAALMELHRLESSGFTAREEASFQRMCLVVSQDLLPHVNKCLRLLYPLHHISLITGVPVTQLQRENFGQLDIQELLQPIDHLLPKKEEHFYIGDSSVEGQIIIDAPAQALSTTDTAQLAPISNTQETPQPPSTEDTTPQPPSTEDTTPQPSSTEDTTPQPPNSHNTPQPPSKEDTTPQPHNTHDSPQETPQPPNTHSKPQETPQFPNTHNTPQQPDPCLSTQDQLAGEEVQGESPSDIPDTEARREIPKTSRSNVGSLAIIKENIGEASEEDANMTKEITNTSIITSDPDGEDIDSNESTGEGKVQVVEKHPHLSGTAYENPEEGKTQTKNTLPIESTETEKQKVATEFVDIPLSTESEPQQLPQEPSGALPNTAEDQRELINGSPHTTDDL